MSDPRVLEVTGATIDEVAPQIPRAESLAAGERVLVRAKARGLFSKLLAHGTPPRAIASALLARGYVDIHAAGDERAGVAATAPSEAP